MIKKVCSMLLTAALLFSALSGCGGGKKPEDAGKDATGTEEKVYTYTIVPALSSPADENAEMKLYWEQKFNAKFELIYLENSKYFDLLNLRIASNQIPDVMNMQSLQYISQYKDEGVLGGWEEEFFRKNAPKLAKMIDEKLPKDAIKLSKIDGKMYTVPGARYHNKFNAPVIWRTDWLKKLGINEIPKKLEDVEKAFYKFRNEDPDGNGKKDTYALSQDGINTIYGAFGVMPGLWLEDKSGNLVFSSVDPKAKEALALLNKWYKDELIDPEFVTGENKGGYWANSHSFANGRIGYTSKGAYYHWRDFSLEEKGLPLIGNSELIKATNPNMSFAFGYPPAGKDGQSGTARSPYVLFSTGFSGELVKDEGKLAKFFSMMEVWCGLDNIEDAIVQSFGIKGKHWDYDANNTPVQKKEFSSIEQLSKMAANVTFQYAENPDVQKALAPVQDKWAMELYKDADRAKFYENKLIVDTASSKKYAAETKKILDEGYIAIITGDKGVDYFDEMVEKWKKAGGEQLTKEANEWYKQFK